MAQVNAVPSPDLVLIYWSRNPLVSGSARRIVSARVIGSSEPCRRNLREGRLLSTALACLLDHDVGFEIVFSKRTTSISGYLLLQRHP